MRVQPHLKKCFEGIYELDFTDEEEIVAMISAEKEYVPLSGTITPADAKVSNYLVILKKYSLKCSNVYYMYKIIIMLLKMFATAASCFAGFNFYFSLIILH